MGFVTSLVGVLAHFRTPSLVFGSTDFGNWFRQGAGAAEIPAVERKDYVRGTSFLIPKRITLDDSVARVPGTSLFSEEDLLQYCEGGYHPVSLGDMFGDRYEVVRKLGFGQNATVWLALDRRLNRHVALKILKAKYYHGTKSIFKVKILQYVKTSDLDHPGRMHGLDLLDSFSHFGPHGTHICMVFEPMHQDLSVLSRRGHDRKIPLVIVKEIAKQMLSALDYLHTSCNMTHTGIQPQNILVSLRGGDFESFIQGYLQSNPQDVYDGRYGELPSYAIASEGIPIELPEHPSQFIFKLSGLGVSTWVDNNVIEPIQDEALRAPEVILGAQWNSSVDIWNLGCLIYKLAQGRDLFTGLADQAGCWTAEEDHLCQIIELCGPVPMDHMRNGRHTSKYLDATGNLLNIEQTYPVPILQIIKYWSPELSKEEISQFADFIGSMLRFDPRDRSTAQEMLNHIWLQT